MSPPLAINVTHHWLVTPRGAINLDVFHDLGTAEIRVREKGVTLSKRFAMRETIPRAESPYLVSQTEDWAAIAAACFRNAAPWKSATVLEPA